MWCFYNCLFDFLGVVGGGGEGHEHSAGRAALLPLPLRQLRQHSFCVCAVSQISDLNIRNTNKVVLKLLLSLLIKSYSCYTVLFGLYSNESDIHVIRDDFQKHLHICENGYIPDSIGALFNEVCFTLYLCATIIPHRFSLVW